MNLTTNYLGIVLRTPLVAAASPFSKDLDQIKRMEDVGISAVVLHSLFEEQISPRDPKITRGDPEDYLDNIRKAKDAVGIPIIASLNGTTPSGWLEYGRRIE